MSLHHQAQHKMSAPENSPKLPSVSLNGGTEGSQLAPSTSTSNGKDIEKGSEPQTLPPDPADWNGEDDPENPLNWPPWLRYSLVVPPAIISFAA
jgi:hypothetical protein